MPLRTEPARVQPICRVLGGPTGGLDVPDIKQEDAGPAVEVRGHTRCIQDSLDHLAQCVGALEGVSARLLLENGQLRRENGELKTRLVQGVNSVRNSAFAGTGEMPPCPFDFPPPQKLHVTAPRGRCVQLMLSPVESQSMERVASTVDSEGTVMDVCDTEAEKRKSLSADSLLASVGVSRPRQAPAGQGRRVFLDPDDMKEQVRKAIARPEYKVDRYYHEHGVIQAIARSRMFEYTTLIVILVNAVWIAVDCDFNTAPIIYEAEPWFQVADHFFCLFFTIELIIRFLAFQHKRDVVKDSWFAFDFFMVVVLVLETWVVPPILVAAKVETYQGMGDAGPLRLLRLVRLTRVARMVKLLRCVPELIIVVKGIGVAVRSVLYTWILMVLVIFIFALAFRQMSFDTELGSKHFPGVVEAMLTLLMKGTLPDFEPFVQEIAEENKGLAVLLMLFILFVSLTVMNMLIGILVDVVSVVSKLEKYQLHVAYVKHKLLSMLETNGIDEDMNQRISRHEFENMLVKPEAAKVLLDLGVDPVGLVDFTDFIFKDQDDLTFPKFMDLVLQLRGANTATVRDIIDLRRWLADEIRNLGRMLPRRSDSVSTG